MVGEQQVATVGGKGLERIDDIVAGQTTGQVLIAEGDAHTVAHHPAHGVVLDVEFIHLRGGEQHSRALVNIGFLEPLHGILLVVGGGVVVGHEHGHLLVGGCAHIFQTVVGEEFQLALVRIFCLDVPLVRSQAYGQHTTCEGGGRCKIDDACATVVNHMIPGAEHGRVGGFFPGLHHIGVGHQSVGVQIPHAVVVALHAGSLEAVDAALIETCGEVHAAVDVVAGVVVNLTFGIADDGLRAPHIVVLTAVAAAEDAGSQRLGQTTHGHGELCGVVGEEEVATVGSKGLERIDDIVAGQTTGQVLITEANAHTVAHHPAGGMLLDVETVHLRGGDQVALAAVHISTLEPFYSCLFIGRRGVVVGHKHSHLAATLLGFVGNVETNGLSLRHTSVGINGLHGIGHIHIHGCLLDEVGVHHFVQSGHIVVVLDDLHAHLSFCCGVHPVERHLATAFFIVGAEVGYLVGPWCLYIFYIRT